ncbi:MAG TPA: hypothetical protein VKV27_16600 [Solirubrobacteraceae bacterium]|nr:hypothetical protein [Solirubrobacteraceae bacterium]
MSRARSSVWTGDLALDEPLAVLVLCWKARQLDWQPDAGFAQDTGGSAPMRALLGPRER